MTAIQLQPLDDDREWFSLCVEPQDLPKPLHHVPGVQWLRPNPKTMLPSIHRTHLPLIGTQPPFAFVTLSELTLSDQFLSAARPYQKKGAQWLLWRKGAILADPMRLGKTLTALGAALVHPPVLVCGPLSTALAWDEWARRLTGKPAFLCVGTSFEGPIVEDARLALQDGRVVFIHYDILPAWQAVAIRTKIGTVIFDEPQLLANKKTARAKAAMNIALDAERRICVTGTPIWNRPRGLWPILNLCTPGAWGSEFEFSQRYCGAEMTAYGWKASGSSNEEELQLRLGEILLRRSWEEVGFQLASLDRVCLRVDVTPKQKFDLECAAAALQDKSARGATVVGMIARLRQVLAEIKLPLAIQLARSAAADEKSTVLWFWHKSLVQRAHDALTSLGCSVRVFSGEESFNERREILEWCRKTPGAVLCATMGAASAGVDFSFADRCVFVEMDWTPAMVGQAEMRVYSPVRPTKIMYLVADHPIDRKVVATLIEKVEVARRVGLPAAETALDLLKGVLE